jgi:hypothetical protein
MNLGSFYTQELKLGDDNDGANPEEIQVSKIIKHEGYNGKYEYFVKISKLKRKIFSYVINR